MEFSYQQIKRLAKELKKPVTDLIALAAQNDPFYQGTPTTLALAEWFADFYHTHVPRGTRIHIRRCHYQIVSLGLRFPNGKPYENTEESWDTLLVASKAARYLKLVDVWSFDDKKNDAAIDYCTYKQPEPSILVSDYLYSVDSAIPDFPDLPSYMVENYEANQPYHVEVWCEKSTMNDLLIPLCKEYGMVLQIGVGELSITATAALAERIRQSAKPTRIFYISDFDPAGLSMPVAVSRKLEYFVRNHNLEADIRLFPLMLTATQVETHHLPRTPIKASERRKTSFEHQYGEDATELDALEALRPGEFERIVRQAVEIYYDRDLIHEVRVQQEALQQTLSALEQEVFLQHEKEIEGLQAELENIRTVITPRMDVYRARLQHLWHAIGEDLRVRLPENHLSRYILPTRRDSEFGDGLYNSDRNYLDQIAVYKKYQGREK